MALLVISFLAGILTVLAPCILPFLPIVIGSSAAGKSKLTPYVVVASLSASVFIFTILLKATTALIAVPASFWQILSGGLLLLFGFATLFPALWDRIPFVGKLFLSSNKLLGTGEQKQGIQGDIIIGLALGPVFSSCSPTYFVILAAVLPTSFFTGVVFLIAYIIGLAISLLAIALVGQKIVDKLGLASDPEGWFKRIIGILFVVVGLAVIFGYDKRLEASLPSSAFGEIGIEQKLLSFSGQSGGLTTANSLDIGATTTAKKEPTETTDKKPPAGFLSVVEKSLKYPKAPELVTPDGYINTGDKPITVGQFKGSKVVLVDFWDYSCINCQRTIPYLNAWYEKYKDQGLVIIGVHTPEFSFEQLKQNVEAAAERFGMKYPITLDNKYQTWGAFQNQYWPREYLIDIDGYIVHDHIGEGDYDGTEKAIQDALKERSSRLGAGGVVTSIVDMPLPDLTGIASPETYFGSSRNQYLGNGTPGAAGVQTFSLPAETDVSPNTLYLGGKWNITDEYAESISDSQIIFEYKAKDVYLVGSASTPVKIKVFLDGLPAGGLAGADVDPKTSEATINGDRLYKLIHDTKSGAHTIKIEVESGALRAYTFTFG